MKNMQIKMQNTMQIDTQDNLKTNEQYLQIMQ